MNALGNILVVDDSQAILTTVRICLADTFDKVITRRSPEDILPTLELEQVSVILLDMNFKLGLNTGQEGLHWLQRLHTAYPNIPIVLMTAYAEVQLAVKGLKNGAADFVTKPWDNDELIHTLRDVIDKQNKVVPLDKLEADHIRRVVDNCHGNISRAAEMLGITRQTLYAKLRK